MDLGLADRVYAVTGGSRGLGFATAQQLVNEGARVVLLSRKSADVDAAVAKLGGSEHAVGLAGDLADAATPSRLIDAATTTFGRLDGALVSVGGPPGGSVETLTDEQWEAAFSTVFIGAVRALRELGAYFVEQGDGSIALVLSSSVRSPIGGLDASNGLRPGLAMLAKSTSDAWGPSGVRVNALLPARIDTERVQQLDALGGDAATARANAETQIPLRRYGTPEEFGRTAAFVLSPAASYVTGTALAVDGGALRSP